MLGIVGTEVGVSVGGGVGLGMGGLSGNGSVESLERKGLR